MLGLAAKRIILSLAVLSFGAAQGETMSQLRAKMEPQSTGKKWAGDWKFELGGANHDEGQDEYAAAYVSSSARLNFRPIKRLRLLATPFAEFVAGRVQERFDDAPLNRIGVHEAFAGYAPVDFFEFRAGILYQRFLDMPQLVSNRRGMPGLQQAFALDFGSRLSARVIAQQLIPTSVSLSSDRAEKEKLPLFQTQSLHVGGFTTNWFEWEVMGGHYQWDQLPSKVAFESQIDGNTVEGELAPGSQFRYGFEGFFWGGELVLGQVGGPQGLLEYKGLTNTKAPSAARDAEQVGGGMKWLVGGVEYKAMYQRYFTEPDASVAYYASSRYGRNNRIGDAIELKVDFIEQKFAVRGEWSNARTINASATQDTWNYYQLSLETHYAPF